MNDRLAVYVPADDALSVGDLSAGSGIVAEPEPDVDRLSIYFEGRRNVSNIVTYADRCANAAGRLWEKYPTSAVRAVSPKAVRQIGWFYAGHGVEVENAEGLVALAKWLGLFDGHQFNGDRLAEELRVTGAWEGQVAQ